MIGLEALLAHPWGTFSALRQTHLSDKPDPHPFQSLTIGREGQSRWTERGFMYQGEGRGLRPLPSHPERLPLAHCPTEPRWAPDRVLSSLTRQVGKLKGEKTCPMPPSCQ